MAAVVPLEGGEPVVGPSLEGSGVGGGFSPEDLQSAYGLSGEGGKSLTIAIVDAFDDPNAEADLNTYREQYGLSACTTANGCFAKVNQEGEEGSYPEAEAGWAFEISLDLDMVSAICPECHILLVEADNNQYKNLGKSVETAVELGAAAVSNSYGSKEFSEETLFDSYFDHPGTPILVSSGDYGYGVEYPSSSPNVIAVGGTSLKKTENPRGWSESVWSGSGSGCSKYEKKPTWQKDKGCENRTTADVSAVASPETPVSVYDSYVYSGWMLAGGTSASAPIIAGIEGLSSSAFRSAGAKAFYEAGENNELFDVMAGRNGECGGSYLCEGKIGYDGPTGWGTLGPPLAGPPSITGGASEVGLHEATLHGTVNPDGKATTYIFQYGSSTAYGFFDSSESREYWFW